MSRSCRLWPLAAGALLLAGVYLPTLALPFDFTDDGNLVYAAPPLSTADHVERWWNKVADNYRHLGPFRPVLWAHWEVEANLFGNDPLTWRAARLVWCVVAAGAFLALLRELNLSWPAALMAGALAFWNPYRNEIWPSLTLSEGVAMPYAFLALLPAPTARRARGCGIASGRSACWRRSAARTRSWPWCRPRCFCASPPRVNYPGPAGNNMGRGHCW